jgi:hypothetical protein
MSHVQKTLRFTSIPPEFSAKNISHIVIENKKIDEINEVYDLILEKLKAAEYPITVILMHLAESEIYKIIKMLTDAEYQTSWDPPILKINNPYLCKDGNTDKDNSNSIYRCTPDDLNKPIYGLVEEKSKIYDVVEVIVPYVWKNTRKEDLSKLGYNVYVSSYDILNCLFTITKKNACETPLSTPTRMQMFIGDPMSLFTSDENYAKLIELLKKYNAVKLIANSITPVLYNMLQTAGYDISCNDMDKYLRYVIIKNTEKTAHIC